MSNLKATALTIHRRHYHQPIDIFFSTGLPYREEYVTRKGCTSGPSADWWLLTTANAAGIIINK
jgi:hypothetical protein